jgi:hypothetical protein
MLSLLSMASLIKGNYPGSLDFETFNLSLRVSVNSLIFYGRCYDDNTVVLEFKFRI